MKKTILMMMPSLYSGGAEKQYRYIIQSIKSKYNVIVILLTKSATGFTKEEQSFIEHNPECSFRFVYEKQSSSLTKCGWFFLKLFGIYKTKKIITKILLDTSIDYVMFSYLNQLLLVNFFNKNNIKCIFNERNTGRQVCNRNYKIQCLKKCYKVISNSKYASRYIENKTSIKVDVYNNGIEFDSLNIVKHNAINIIVPARVTQIKNQLLLLEALQFLSFSNYKVFLIGGGDENYLSKIKDYIKQHHLENCVELVGFSDSMKTFYQIADFVVLPSFEEGTPNVLLESYMYKILPLCSNIDMNLDCVIYQDLMFSPDNPNELADKLNKYYNLINTEYVDQILNSNYDFVINNYSLETMKNKYISLFK